VQALEAHNNKLKEVKTAYKTEEMNILLQQIPALRSEDRAARAQASQDIIDAAAFYGFTPDEINEAADHRVFKMAYDAQQYRKLKKHVQDRNEGEARETHNQNKPATQSAAFRRNAPKERRRPRCEEGEGAEVPRVNDRPRGGRCCVHVGQTSDHRLT
jgi:hypothetical protein